MERRRFLGLRGGHISAPIVVMMANGPRAKRATTVL